MFNNLKWSPDLQSYMKELAELVGVSFMMPERYVPTQWLSILNCADDFLNKKDPYAPFYFLFIQSNDDRSLYKTDIDILLHDKNDKVKSQVKQIQAILRKKKLTEDGQKRTDRIIRRLFIQSKQMLLYVNFYCAVLPLLKRFVLLFQTQKPMIHILHDEQFSLVKKFLGCFIKPECIKDLQPKKLVHLEIKQEMLQKEVFLGQSTDKLLEKRQEPEFVEKAKSAYKICTTYLLKKMPINNSMLRHLSAMDPQAQGNEITHCHLKRFPLLISNVLNKGEEQKFVEEVYTYNVDDKLPSAFDVNGEAKRINKCWTEVQRLDKYPNICKIVFVLLPCFSCPVVEISFSIMGNIMDETTNRLNIESLSTIQTIKY